MFTHDLVDTRTRSQRQADTRRANPQQALMFPQREMAQFGVNGKPLLPLSPQMKLSLVAEDPRTDEEKARDLQRHAEQNTVPMFARASPGKSWRVFSLPVRRQASAPRQRYMETSVLSVRPMRLVGERA